jgi:hypothetical protein
MKQLIHIHGSGTNIKVHHTDYKNHAWVNISHLRSVAKHSKLWALTISDGLLLTPNELKNRNAIEVMNFDKNQSYLHRLQRREHVSNITVDILFCNSNKTKNEIKHRLKEMNVMYKDLHISSDLQINSFVKQALGSQYRKSNVYKNLTTMQKLKIFCSQLFKLRIKYPSKVRPSTGIVTLLLFLFKYPNNDVRFEVTGISGKISSDDVHPIDKEILSKLKNHPRFQFVKINHTESPLGFEFYNDQFGL